MMLYPHALWYRRTLHQPMDILGDWVMSLLWWRVFGAHAVAA